MLIFELTKPGSYLNYDDRELCWKFESLLGHLETAFYDANVSLNFFNAERESSDDFINQRQDDFQRRSIIEAQELQELGVQPYKDYEKVRAEVDARLRKEKWSNGVVPLNHRRRFVFLYAQSFLYALDTIEKFLKVLSEENGAPEIIKELHAKVGDDFPNLKGVRNSAQHLEARARGLDAGRSPRPLKLQPVDNGFVVAPQGALMLGNLFDTKLGYTMANGHHGEVDISEESMSKITSILQEVFNSFTWKGAPQHLPQ